PAPVGIFYVTKGLLHTVTALYGIWYDSIIQGVLLFVNEKKGLNQRFPGKRNTARTRYRMTSAAKHVIILP
ncbi:MAG: hypothetical protein IJP92_07585, partial [Lachnospiraceae bacterium]|nr:hypothetical protein [Lachnospiraceae bacterium]